jgi:hypothetical protein
MARPAARVLKLAVKPLAKTRPRDVIAPKLRTRSTRDLASQIAEASNALMDMIPERKSADHAPALIHYLALIDATLALVSCRETSLTAPPDPVSHRQSDQHPPAQRRALAR